MTDIVMVRAWSISADPRITKTMLSLSKEFNVLALGWDRELADHRSVIINERLRVKQLRLRCSYQLWSALLLLPVFWLWILLQLFVHKPRFVCAFDLNTLVVCYVYRVVCRHSLLVFDIGDRFAMFVPKKYGIIHHAVDFLEERLASLSDGCTVASTMLLNTFSKWAQENFAIILNSPRQINIEISPKKGAADLPQLTIVYTGLIWERRGLRDVVRAIDGMQGVRLKIAGRVMDARLLDFLLKKQFVEYLGLQSYHNALQLEGTGDIMIALYDPIEPITQIAMPNKAYEAMMLGIPLVTNLSHIIKSVECGIVVEYGNVDSLRQAIEFLKNNPTERLRLGQNGLRMFKYKFDWAIMEKRLLNLYRSINR